MPKKKVQPKRSNGYALKLTVLLFSVFIFVIGLTVFLNVKAHPYCANSISCTKDLSGKKENANEGVFMGRNVTAPELPNKEIYAMGGIKNVLGDTTGNNKHIEVDLTNQRLYAFQGNTKVYDFPVSTGKWGPTPTGTFHIWIWLRYTRMVGGNPAIGTYYNLPNVPYTMYFYQGYGIHGAYWHNNFGHPMSHGCVNMRVADAGTIYYWTNPNAGNVAYPTAANPGTQVTIYGTPPNN